MKWIGFGRETLRKGELQKLRKTEWTRSRHVFLTWPGAQGSGHGVNWIKHISLKKRGALKRSVTEVKEGRQRCHHVSLTRRHLKNLPQHSRSNNKATTTGIANTRRRETVMAAVKSPYERQPPCTNLRYATLPLILECTSSNTGAWLTYGDARKD